MNGERLVAVTGREHIALGGDDADAEVIGIGLTKLGDIGRDLPVRHQRVSGVELGDQFLQSVVLGDSHPLPSLRSRSGHG